MNKKRENFTKSDVGKMSAHGWVEMLTIQHRQRTDAQMSLEQKTYFFSIVVVVAGNGDSHFSNYLRGGIKKNCKTRQFYLFFLLLLFSPLSERRHSSVDLRLLNNRARALKKNLMLHLNDFIASHHCHFNFRCRK